MFLYKINRYRIIVYRIIGFQLAMFDHHRDPSMFGAQILSQIPISENLSMLFRGYPPNLDHWTG